MNLFDSWAEMAGKVRASLIVGLVIIVVLTAGAFFWLTKDNYQVLFKDLEPRDAASVVSELERMKVKYRLADDGRQIQVPEPSVHELRLKLMGAGVPLVGGVGFEIFNDAGFGMTEFAQRINYQRALEGELTRTMMSLKEVKYARVHLVMPERGIFQQENNQPSASVTLFLDAGRQPIAEQILGIQRLVSAAVPRLQAWQVTVTDQNGLTLSRQIPENEGVAAVSGRLEQKQAVENYLTEKAEKVLVRNFGPGQAMVSIDAVLDFNQVKRTRESVLPSDNQRVTRRRETKQNSGPGQRDGEATTTEVEYRLGRDVEQITGTPGEIVRLSVAVMVPKETSEVRRKEIRELVMMAVGFDSLRGDGMAVYAFAESGQARPFSAKALLSDDPGSQELAGFPISQMREPVEWETEQPRLRKEANLTLRSPASAWVGALAVGIVLITALLYHRVVRKSPVQVSPPPLSEAERVRVLSEIRRWLNTAND